MIPRLDNQPAMLSIHQAFLTELAIHGFEGEIGQQQSDRLIAATDNSIYQRMPDAVVFPKHAQDVQLIAKIAAQSRFQSVVLAPRGGGTGTNGQSLTSGIVVDLSKHLNQILEINVEERWARVQSGVVKDQLNAALAPHGLFFAPELSTSNRATIGGMVNTDASGQGSCMYGKTRDHVLSLKTVLPGGLVYESEPIEGAELDAALDREDKVGEIHRLLDHIQDTYADEIEATFPKLNRCLTGYDLAHIYDEHGRFDLNAILCGSEGTLGMIVEAKINVLPIPTCSAILSVRYPDFDSALRDAPVLMKLNAASIETVDSLVLQLAQKDIIWHAVAEYFPANPNNEPTLGINLVEFVAMNETDLEKQLAEITAFMERDQTDKRFGYTIARGQKAVNQLWTMRKKSVGLLGGAAGDRRPLPFVEDTAVPPENLADYIAEFRALLDSHGLRYGMFGHADAGVLHVRPALDMKDTNQEPLIRTITEGVAALTKKYNGLLWGEHGKGLRSEYAPAFFGKLYPVLQQIKQTFDPFNQYNPGKIATIPGATLTAVDAVPLRGHFDRQIPIVVRQAYDEGLHCNGNGACYNYDQDDYMCPSWKVTRDRRHSPKGRASLLREWLRQLAQKGIQPVGKISQLSQLASLPKKLWFTISNTEKADFSHEVKSAMDGCLACKSCAGQCPIKVDVPSFRSKFLYYYHQRYLRPVKDYLVASMEFIAPIAAKLPAAYNLLTQSAIGRYLLGKLGLVHSPALKPLAIEPMLTRGLVQLATPAKLAALSDAQKANSVIIVQDVFTRYFEPKVLQDLILLLNHLGITPWLAPLLPNGKPLHVHGFLGWFEKVAKKNQQNLAPLATSGVPLLGVDPSMTLTYRGEYAKTLGAEQAIQVMLVQEWLTAWLKKQTNLPQAKVSATHWLLSHCSEKTSQPQSHLQWQSIYEQLGITLKPLQTGCCGMAGIFGHEAKHRETSQAIYAQSWKKVVEDEAKRDQLVATGYSCRCQAKLESQTELPHPVSVLKTALVG